MPTTKSARARINIDLAAVGARAPTRLRDGVLTCACARARRANNASDARMHRAKKRDEQMIELVCARVYARGERRSLEDRLQFEATAAAEAAAQAAEEAASEAASEAKKPHCRFCRRPQTNNNKKQ